MLTFPQLFLAQFSGFWVSSEIRAAAHHSPNGKGQPRPGPRCPFFRTNCLDDHRKPTPAFHTMSVPNWTIRAEKQGSNADFCTRAPRLSCAKQDTTSVFNETIITLPQEPSPFCLARSPLSESTKAMLSVLGRRLTMRFDLEVAMLPNPY
jgi:hypothetical protein